MLRMLVLIAVAATALFAAGCEQGRSQDGADIPDAALHAPPAPTEVRLDPSLLDDQRRLAEQARERREQ